MLPKRSGPAPSLSQAPARGRRGQCFVQNFPEPLPFPLTSTKSAARWKPPALLNQLVGPGYLSQRRGRHGCGQECRCSAIMSGYNCSAIMSAVLFGRTVLTSVAVLMATGVERDRLLLRASLRCVFVGSPRAGAPGFSGAEARPLRAQSGGGTRPLIGVPPSGAECRDGRPLPRQSASWP